MRNRILAVILIILVIVSPVLIFKPLDTSAGKTAEDLKVLLKAADIDTTPTIIPFNNKRQFTGDLTLDKFLYLHESVFKIDKIGFQFARYKNLIDYRSFIYTVLSIYFYGSKYRSSQELST